MQVLLWSDTIVTSKAMFFCIQAFIWLQLNKEPSQMASNGFASDVPVNRCSPSRGTYWVSLSEECIKTPRKFTSFHTWVKSIHHSPWWDFCLFWPLPPWPLLNVQPQSNVWIVNSFALVPMTKRQDAMPWILACKWRTQMAVLVNSNSILWFYFLKINCSMCWIFLGNCATFCSEKDQLCPGGVDYNGCPMKDFCSPSDCKYKIHQNCFTGFSAIFNHFILMRSIKFDEIPCK